MYSVVVILAIIVAIMLVFIVCIQESKGGGLASNFAASNQIMGVRKTTDVVEKATWTLAGVLVVLAIASSFFAPRQADIDSVVTSAKPAASTPATPATNTPATNTPVAPAQ